MRNNYTMSRLSTLRELLANSGTIEFLRTLAKILQQKTDFHFAKPLKFSCGIALRENCETSQLEGVSKSGRNAYKWIRILNHGI